MKYGFIAMGLAAVLFAACTVNELDRVDPAGLEEEVFHASIEDSSTRVFVDDQLRVLWNADDRVSIFNRTTYNWQYRFDGEDGDNSGVFKKVPIEDFATSNPLDHVYSVYPYNEKTRISNDGELGVYLPAGQVYREDSFGLGANTMIAIADDNELMFKNLCGYVVLRLYGADVTVSSISFKGNNNEPLAGKASVHAALNDVPSLSMDESATREIMLTCGTPVTLGTTAETATTFWLVVPPTVFSKGITLTVRDIDGRVFEKSTTKGLDISRNTKSAMAALRCEMAGDPNPEAVDLGLSVKWALFNLGACAPEGYGVYTAWGETEIKEDYSWATYKWCDGAINTFTKYCTQANYGSNGFVDDKEMLDPEDDVARVVLGDKWRMPVDLEWSELLEHCTWEWTMLNGVSGYRVTSKVTGYSDKWIFLPAAGRKVSLRYFVGDGQGYYWSSSLYRSPDYAGSLYFHSTLAKSYSMLRRIGQSIRPVYGDPFVPVESISLSRTNLDLIPGESATLSATVMPENASVRDVKWFSSDENVATVSSTGVVRGIAPGSAVIFATTLYGGSDAACSVSVTDPLFRAQWHFSAEDCLGTQDGTAYGYTFSSGVPQFNSDGVFSGFQNAASKEAGDGGLYVDSNVSPGGRITFVQIDKTELDQYGNADRTVGSTGHPYVRGSWIGDYWLFTLSNPNHTHAYPTGTKVHIKYLARVSIRGYIYWMLEYWDGAQWVPAREVQNGVAQYNLQFENNVNQIIDCTYELAAPCAVQMFRQRLVSNYYTDTLTWTYPEPNTTRIAANASVQPFFEILASD